MVDGGIGITATAALASNLIQRSRFPSRHNASYEQEAEKSLKTGVRFDMIPKEDVDYFEAEEYNSLRSKCEFLMYLESKPTLHVILADR